MGCPSPTNPVHSYTANTFWSISRSKRGFGFLPNAVGLVIVILEHCQVLAKTGVILVGDPFGEYIPDDLRLWFDRVAAFNALCCGFLEIFVYLKAHAYDSGKAAAAVGDRS